MEKFRDGVPNRLHHLRHKVSTRDYFGQIWERRDFLIVVPRQDARARQMTTALGQLWHLLNPALMIGVYYLIFGVLLAADRGIEHYVSFLTIGILMFQLVQKTVVDAATAIPRHIGLIRTVQFPRALLPLSTTVEHLVTFVPAGVLLFVVTWMDGSPFRWQMVLFPAIIVATTVTFSGGAFVTARLGSFIPDMRELLPHLFRILLYASGVLFSIDNMIGNTTIRAILKANPIHLFLSLGRWSMLGMPITMTTILASLAWMFVLPVIGFIFFRAGEHTYGG